MRSPRCRFCLLVLMQVAYAAPAKATDVGGSPSTQGTARGGTVGGHRVSAAQMRPTGSLVMVLEGAYGQKVGFFGPTDQLQFQRQGAHVAYTPTRHWALAAGIVTQGAADSLFYSGGPSTSTLFTLQGMGYRQLGANFDAGLSLSLNLPAQQSGLGIGLGAVGGEARLQATYHVRRETYTISAGYLLDRGDHYFAGSNNRLQQLALDSASGDRWLLGALAHAWFSPGADVGLAAFAEVDSQWSTRARAIEDPVVLGLGVRLVPAFLPRLELTVGIDLRLLGVPRSDSLYPGVLPWLAFAQLAVHIGPMPEPAPFKAAISAPATPLPLTHARPPYAVEPYSSLPCDASCPNRPVQECPDMRGPRPVLEPNHVVVAGKVLNTLGKPMHRPRVTVSTAPELVVSTHPETGYFETPPVPCDANHALVVTAITHNDAFEMAMPMDCSRPYPPNVTLTPTHPRPASAVFEISWSSGRRPSGRGAVEIQGAAGSPFDLPPDGILRVQLPAGRHVAKIRSPGFAAQEKVMQLEPGQTNVYNIVLRRIPAE